MPSKIIPQEHRDAMIAAYLAGESAEKAAALFGYSTPTCLTSLRQAGLLPRSHKENSRKYSVDESFFDKIDSEEKAYWLGFLTADGTVGPNYIKLSLQSGDKEHLSKFNTSLQSNYPVISRQQTVTEKVYTYVTVHIISHTLVSALNRLGVENNKSFTVRPCIHVPDVLLSHYWRGIFDGDGSVFLQGRRTKSGYPQWVVKLVGNQHIVSGFASFIQRFIPDATIDIRPHFRIFTKIYVGVDLPQKVLQVLYRDATIFLDRKKNSADELAQAKVRKFDRIGVTKEQLETLYAQHQSWVAVANELGVSIRYVHNRKRLFGIT